MPDPIGSSGLLGQGGRERGACDGWLTGTILLLHGRLAVTGVLHTAAATALLLVALVCLRLSQNAINDLCATW